jgi:hypothetical protein
VVGLDDISFTTGKCPVSQGKRCMLLWRSFYFDLQDDKIMPVFRCVIFSKAIYMLIVWIFNVKMNVF